MDIRAFLEQFKCGFENEYINIAFGTPENIQQFSFDELPIELVKNYEEHNVYFGPSVRKKGKNTLKNVIGSRCVWAEADVSKLIIPLIPPSLIILSGFGHHMYWFLREPIIFNKRNSQLEDINRILIRNFPGADKNIFNANRMLRVPFTKNIKQKREGSLPVKIIYHNPNLLYTPEDFWPFDKLSANLRLVNMIRTGSYENANGEHDRSERDFRIMLELFRMNFSENVIYNIFHSGLFACSDKLDEHTDPKHYWSVSITNAKKIIAEGADSVRLRLSDSQTAKEGEFIVQFGSTYHKKTSSGTKRISNFYIKPLYFLSPIDEKFTNDDEQEYLVAELVSQSQTRKVYTFEPDDFTTTNKFSRKVKSFSFTFTGTDADLRNVFDFIHIQSVEDAIPRKEYTTRSGLYHFNDEWVFLIGDQVIKYTGVEDSLDAGLKWINPVSLKLYVNGDKLETNERKVFLENIFDVNEKHNMLAVLGWTFFIPLKQWVREQGYRIPILNLTGTRGSGKTTLVQNVIMPILGFQNSKAVNSRTSQWPVVPLMNQSNTFPVPFIEVVGQATIERYSHIVKIAYDETLDFRGRPDLSVNEFTYTASIILDGEDFSSDPAVKERMILIRCVQETILQDTLAYSAWENLQPIDLRHISSGYFNFLLEKLNKNEQWLKDKLANSRAQVYAEYPKLSPRITNNIALVYFGVTLFAEYFNIDRPTVSSLYPIIDNVFNFTMRRTKLDIDGFLEDVINFINESDEPERGDFYFKIKDDGKTLILSKVSYNWWRRFKRSQGVDVKQKEALLAQIDDISYATERLVKEFNQNMIYIDIPAMNAERLDVPSHLGPKGKGFDVDVP